MHLLLRQHIAYYVLINWLQQRLSYLLLKIDQQPLECYLCQCQKDFQIFSAKKPAKIKKRFHMSSLRANEIQVPFLAHYNNPVVQHSFPMTCKNYIFERGTYFQHKKVWIRKGTFNKFNDLLLQVNTLFFHSMELQIPGQLAIIEMKLDCYSATWQNDLLLLSHWNKYVLTFTAFHLFCYERLPPNQNMCTSIIL